MSTRGAIAVQHGDTWRGVYNHSDSYPSGLGADLAGWVTLAGRIPQLPAQYREAVAS